MSNDAVSNGGASGMYLEEDLPDLLLLQHLHAVRLALLLGDDQRVDVEAGAIRRQAAAQQPDRLNVPLRVADAQPAKRNHSYV